MRAVAVRSRSILLSLAAAMCRPVAGIITTSPPTILRARSVVTARSPLNMQYGYVDALPGYGAQQGYGDQQNYGDQVLLTVAGVAGVRGFSNVAGSYQKPNPDMQDPYYKKDYRFLPYTLCNGEQQVLSRWNMVKQRLTVSRMQCIVQVTADGIPAVISCGRGPTLWRAPGGPWNGLYRDQWKVLDNGDQLSLDWHDPDAAVFTCQVTNAMQQASYPQQEYMQQDYAQQGYAQQGYAQELPAGWSMGVDEASGATYYYNEQTGQTQWDPPLAGYSPQGGY